MIKISSDTDNVDIWWLFMDNFLYFSIKAHVGTHWNRLPITCEPRHDKTNKVTVRPAKTQISLGIRPVWSASSLSAWRKLGSLATHWAHSQDWSDWADAQADLNIHWAHSHIVGFVVRRLMCAWRNRELSSNTNLMWFSGLSFDDTTSREQSRECVPSLPVRMSYLPL